jgi:predicted small lipoprotein YifL
MTRILTLLLWTALLSACGQKGALYLPPPEMAETAPPAEAPTEKEEKKETLSPEEIRLLSPDAAPVEPQEGAAPQGGGESPPEYQPLLNP